MEIKNLTRNEFINIDYNEYDFGFMFESYYDDKLLLMIEANINQIYLGIPNGKKQPRNIMITGTENVSHSGRMKISLYGKPITRNNHNEYIEIYRKNKNTITYIGNLKDINMSNKEYKLYEDLFIRNENLIQFVSNSKGEYKEYIDSAFIHDEKLRREGYIVERDPKNGNVYIYLPNGDLVKVKSITGGELDVNEIY